jgi:hypothetical protein
MNSMGDLQRCGCAIGGGTGYALWLISCCIPCCGVDKPLLKKFPGIVFICVCINLCIYVYTFMCLLSNMYISMYLTFKYVYIYVFLFEDRCLHEFYFDFYCRRILHCWVVGIIIIVIIFIYYHYIYQT